MKKNYTFQIFYIIVTLSLMHCATYTKNGNSRLEVISKIDSSIYVNEEKIGETYAIKKIGFPSDNNKEILVRVEKSGYEIDKFTLKEESNPWIWGNLVFLAASPIGFGIDYFSGSFTRYTPLQNRINLNPNPKFKENKKSESYINYQNKISENGRLEAFLYYGNLTDIEVIRLEDQKKLGQLFEFTSINGPQKPGKYKISGKFSFKEIKGNITTTYTAKKGKENIFEIPGGGITVICGSFDGKNKSTELKLFHIIEQNYQEFAGLASRESYAIELSNKCHFLSSIDESDKNDLISDK